MTGTRIVIKTAQQQSSGKHCSRQIVGCFNLHRTGKLNSMPNGICFQSDSTYDIIFSWNLWLVAHVYSILYVSCPGSPSCGFPSWNRQILPGSNSPRTQWSYPWPKKNSQGAVAERGSARQRATWRQRGGGVWLRMVEKPTFNQQKWDGKSVNFWVFKFPYVDSERLLASTSTKMMIEPAIDVGCHGQRGHHENH